MELGAEVVDALEGFMAQCPVEGEAWERTMRARAVVPAPAAGNENRKKALEPYRLTLRAVQSMQVPESLATEAERARPDDLGSPQVLASLA